MKKSILYFLTFIAVFYSRVSAQDFMCFPEYVTFASNGGSVLTVEKTTVNWDRIDYHINGNTAMATTYKESEHAATKLNPSNTDEMTVLENTSDRIVLIRKKVTDILSLTVDVLFPKDGNGYSFYVSDYPKIKMGGKSDLINLSKLYMLKCQPISTNEK